MRKPINLFFFLSVVVVLFTACPDEQEPPQRDTTINLQVEKTGITTVSLKVSVEDTSDSWTFGLTRNDSLVLSSEVTGADTVIRDGGLSPATTYRYRAYYGESADSSEEVLATTLDTTSHNFVWTIDTLGNYGSYLYDVAIIDENNIWVVGYINTDSGTYNAARWDGSEWEYIKIVSGTLTLYSIQYFSEDDIWVLGSYPIHWDGEEWTHYHLTNMGIIPGGLSGEIWGSNPNNIYFVGRSGRIVHYDGSGFTKMESGTDTRIIDIWGLDENHVWAVAYDNTIDESHPDGYESVALFYDGSSWERLYVHPYGYWPDVTDSISGGMTSVWAYKDTVYICSAAGIWAKPVNGAPGILHRPNLGFQSWGFRTIRGTGYSDIFITTPFSQTFHYNGHNWRKIESFSDEHPDGALLAYGGLDIKSNMVVVAGAYYGSKAFIMRGYRME